MQLLSHGSHISMLTRPMGAAKQSIPGISGVLLNSIAWRLCELEPCTQPQT